MERFLGPGHYRVLEQFFLQGHLRMMIEKQESRNGVSKPGANDGSDGGSGRGWNTLSGGRWVFHPWRMKARCR
jgi:hypothetical protein